MSKLAIVLVLALVTSTFTVVLSEKVIFIQEMKENEDPALQWVPRQYVDYSVEELKIDNAIDTLNIVGQNAQKAYTNITDEIENFKNRTTADILKMRQKVIAEMREIDKGSREAHTDYCNHPQSVLLLLRELNLLLNQTYICVDSETTFVFQSMERANKAFNVGLNLLTKTRTESKNCYDGISFWKDMSCLKKFSAAANTTSTETISALNSEFTDSNTVENIQSILEMCDPKDKVDKVNNQSLSLLEQYRECIQEHINED